MPGGDGTGPTSGPGRGKNLGNSRGGKGGNIGSGGNCFCSSCGKIVTHQRGVPCSQTECPDCGVKMTKQR